MNIFTPSSTFIHVSTFYMVTFTPHHNHAKLNVWRVKKSSIYLCVSSLFLNILQNNIHNYNILIPISSTFQLHSILCAETDIYIHIHTSTRNTFTNNVFFFKYTHTPIYSWYTKVDPGLSKINNRHPSSISIFPEKLLTGFW